jgi:GDPmannose 4,6-dehydratase
MKRALVTGVTGQDGSYLAELLLGIGYEVFGLARRTATTNHWRIEHLFSNEHFHMIDGDMTDMGSLVLALQEAMPDEVYNMAGQSFVPTSFKNKAMTFQVNTIGVANLLDAIRAVCPDARMVQASTSEIYGAVLEMPQTEKTPPRPRSPYGISKLAAYWLVINKRESDGLHASNSICFNHESERRGIEFVTRKITRGVASISLGVQEKISLGNLDAQRDWGYAPEFVEAMWRMLQQDEPDDYVIATGYMHTVRDFCDATFAAVGIPISWSGTGVDEKGTNTDTGKVVVDVNTLYFRPAEVATLVGDSYKAKHRLGWEAQVRMPELVKRMVAADLERLQTPQGERIPLQKP